MRPRFGCNSFYFYIKPQLSSRSSNKRWCCNSFYFYIKPQHLERYNLNTHVVIHSISTSNHNVCRSDFQRQHVVIHSISTSNHNPCGQCEECRRGCNSFYFYIKPQHTNGNANSTNCCNSFYFYIKPQPSHSSKLLIMCCNSFYFYIKPQLLVLQNLLQ